MPEKNHSHSAYIHIPFCIKKCPYCDFYSYAGLGEHFEDYTTALIAEIRQARNRFPDESISTIYIGGGTPNILSTSMLRSIVEQLTQSFRIEPEAEITIEANPGLPIPYSPAIHACHTQPNRLSLGIQSLRDAELKALGRIHTTEQAIQAYQTARDNGFVNIGLDLMYGIPHQTPGSWRSTLQQAVALSPEHISLYSLTIEEGTPFWNMRRSGNLQLPGDDIEADMYEDAIRILTEAGFRHYEISNFARPGFQCRHNLTYWRNEPYFGFGAGASAYLEGCRTTNAHQVQEYKRRAQTGESLIETKECLTGRAAMGEAIFLGLRMISGLDTQAFKERYGLSPDEIYGTEITRLKKSRLLEESGTHLRLTHRGLLYANDVFTEFVE